MKPDQHKKKRSAQYKKKHGIPKDKTGNVSNGKGSENRDGKSKTNKLTSAATDGDSTPNDQGQQCNTNNKVYDEKVASPTFSRRKILSNWDRYDGLPDDEDEEVVTERGVDFKRLLSETGRAEAQFRFKDEQGWGDDGMLQTDVGSKLLSLNVDALTRHIKAIPLPERLGISRLLFEEDVLEKLDKDAAQNVSDTNNVHAVSHQSISTGRTTVLPMNSGKDEANIAESVSELTLKEAAEQQQTNNLESLKSALSTTAAGVISSSKVKVQTEIKGQDNICDQASDERTHPVDNQDVSVETNSKDQDLEEDELDFLLSLENPVQVKGQNAMTNGVMEDDNTEYLEDADTSTDQQSVDTPLLQTACQPNPTAMDDGKDDLEEWLDDMLDD